MGKKGDETRRMIREKAAGLFAQRGFKNVTMNDICQATGLSRGGLYRHYDSTKQIFSEIVDELMQAQDNELSEKMKAEFPATQILDEILERYRQEMVDGEASLSVAIYEYYSGSATDDRENLLSKQYEYSVEMWSAFISYGIRRRMPESLLIFFCLLIRECGCTAPLCLWMSRYRCGSFIM